MVSALVSGWTGPGLNPGLRHCCVFSVARRFTLTVPLSNQVYKLVPANLMLLVILQQNSISSRGSKRTPSRFMILKRA